MSCRQCVHLTAVQAFRSLAELERGLAVVRANVADGTLAEAAYWPEQTVRFAQPPFAQLGRASWPDVFTYYFRCAGCGALYRFSAETYHGRGGQWRPVERAT